MDIQEKYNLLKNNILNLLEDQILSCNLINNELTIEILATDVLDVMLKLKSNLKTMFEQCVDLCGVDYLLYTPKMNYRFAVVYHLLSLTHNLRLRVRAFILDDKLPIISSVCNIWNGVNWFEREAFDLFGIMFEGHPDLRRILTDYDFEGYPFRKDFPLSGYVEATYDEKQQRVVYEPVTVEPREITPRIIYKERSNG